MRSKEVKSLVFYLCKTITLGLFSVPGYIRLETHLGVEGFAFINVTFEMDVMGLLQYSPG